MRTCPLFLLLPAVAFGAGGQPGYWHQLARADAVVVAKVERVEGKIAHLAVQKTLKGQVPAVLALPKDTGVGCFSDQAFFAADAVVVPVSRTGRLVREQFLATPESERGPGFVEKIEELAKDAEARQEWAVHGDLLRVGTGELSRAVALVEQGLALSGPTDAWALALLKLHTTHAQGVDHFEQPGHAPNAEARAEEARALRSGEVRLWWLGRVLRWVAPIDDPGLTRAAFDVLRKELARPPPGRIVEDAVTQLARRLDPKAADPVVPQGQEGWDREALVRAKARFAELEKAAATSLGR